MRLENKRSSYKLWCMSSHVLSRLSFVAHDPEHDRYIDLHSNVVASDASLYRHVENHVLFCDEVGHFPPRQARVKPCGPHGLAKITRGRRGAGEMLSFFHMLSRIVQNANVTHVH